MKTAIYVALVIIASVLSGDGGLNLETRILVAIVGIISLIFEMVELNNSAK